MPAVKVFASFDCDNDEDLLHKLIAVGKAPESKFVVFDRSTKEAPSPEATDRLRERISRVDAVLFLCGAWSHRAANVNAELKMAQELGKRYYFLKGRWFRDCARPMAARLDDKMFKWTREGIQQLVLRNI